MARAQGLGYEPVYEAAARWVDAALRRDDSLFTPGTAVWSPPVIADLITRFVDHPDVSKKSFMEKFRGQLAEAPSATIQLAGEVLYIHFLISLSVTGDHKREIIREVLSWARDAVDMPEDLAAALDGGICHAGIGFHTYRPAFLRYLILFARDWRDLTPGERDVALNDPWRFRELVYATDATSALSQRDALLHLVHPDAFESMIAMPAKTDIARTFAELVDDRGADIDRQLWQIRQKLTPRYGENFDFWAEPLKSLWRPSEEAKRWDVFVDWAKQLFTSPTYGAEERDYKIEIATRLAKVRQMVEDGDPDWYDSLKAVFSWKDYNLTSFYAHSPFLSWAKDHREEAAEHLLNLWTSPDPSGAGIRAFREDVPPEAQHGSPLPLISVLLMAIDATVYPSYAATAVKPAMKMVGYPLPSDDLDTAGIYQHALAFFDRIIEEANSRGVELSDRLDAQSIAWWLTKGNPLAAWPENKVKAFLDYRAGVSGGLDEAERELAKPFATIFTDYEEAAWAFDLLEQMADRLGLTGPDDPRFSCSLRYRDRGLHFNFCNWLIAGFYAPGFRDHRVMWTLKRDCEAFGDLSEAPGFKSDADEPGGAFVYPTIEQAQNLTPAQRADLNASLDYMADRFANYSACPYRHAHVPEIGRAVFDRDFRVRYLTGHAPQAPDRDYTLDQMAEETGFDEAELRSWVSALERKKQAILYGPPGTGKTYVARRLAQYLVAKSEADDGFFELVQFHPTYAYEDFMQGIRPQVDEESGLTYGLERGRFLEFIDKARERRGTCVLIIDEINRANVARVFGELMYLLEYRDDEIALASGGTLRIPDNVRLIGTMNTADRSIALVDHALRRRFAFLELTPQYHVLTRFHADKQTGFPVASLLEVLDKVNAQIRDPHYFVGISFFIDENLHDTIESVWRTEIFPYLDEYFFDRGDLAQQFTWDAVRAQLEL